MAELLKVNGNTVAPSQQIGRDVWFVGVSCASAVLNDAYNSGSETYLDKVRQVIDQASSITLIGATASDTDVVFMVEGAGFGGPGSGVEPDASADVSLQDQADAIDALLVAIPTAAGGANALGAVDVTFNTIVGVAFVATVTSA